MQTSKQSNATQSNARLRLRGGTGRLSGGRWRCTAFTANTAREGMRSPAPRAWHNVAGRVGRQTCARASTLAADSIHALQVQADSQDTIFLTRRDRQKAVSVRCEKGSEKVPRVRGSSFYIYYNGYNNRQQLFSNYNLAVGLPCVLLYSCTRSHATSAKGFIISP
jgi:hypothetical protein